MKLTSVTISVVKQDLWVPFTTSFGTQTDIHKVFVTLKTDEGIVGLGESPTLNDPAYKAESDYAAVVTSLKHHLIPSLKRAQKQQGDIDGIEKLLSAYSWVKGANFAKSALEAALWHILSQKSGKTFSQLWQGTRHSFPVGVSVGGKTVEDVVKRADQAVAMGYTRLKVKIWPGFDVEVIKAVRKKHPKILLQVDANSAFNLKNYRRLKKLDAYNLLLIEQPLADDDVIDHAAISKHFRTPICLDESIHSDDDARRAISLWKKNKLKKRLIINIKPPRVGGYTESIKIAKRCAKEGMDVWCGGMLESGWGKYMNLCFNTRKELTLPGDHFSPTGEYFKLDIIKPALKVEQGIYHTTKAPTILWSNLNKMTVTKNTYKLV